MVKRKAQSPAATATSPKKPRNSKPAPTTNVEDFKQFTPTSEFAKSYSLNLPGADAYYMEGVRMIDVYLAPQLILPVYSARNRNGMVRGAQRSGYM